MMTTEYAYQPCSINDGGEMELIVPKVGQFEKREDLTIDHVLELVPYGRY